jgi:bifunctional N-acetylglucosamine-1-phosphate-uridyltransferase/glucosamine-1-phosphate-acetyltransferase GlmU-like protein
MRSKSEEKIRESTVAIVPAGGSGFRSTPLWTRLDPYTDTISKPAMRDLFWRKTYLDTIFSTIMQCGLVKSILLSAGRRVGESIEECRDERDLIDLKALMDLKAIVAKWSNVRIFFDNPGDKGTGAAATSFEGKKLVEESGAKYVFIYYGDVPTVPPEEIRNIIKSHVSSGAKITIVTSDKGDPFMYGRIVRYPKKVLGLVDEKDVKDEKSLKINRMIRSGELIALRLPEVDTGKYGEWASYVFLSRRDVDRAGDKVCIYHPIREALPGGKIVLSREQLEERRVRLDGKALLFDPMSDEFLDIKEQDEIGVTEEQRRNIGSLEVNLLDFKVSTDYLNAIRERNTGLMAMNVEVYLNVIRDVDAPNYGRVLKDGSEIVVPNSEIFSLKPGEKRHGLSREELLSINLCRRIGPSPPGVYVLERHAGGEYFLPEVSKEAVSKGERINIYLLKGEEGVGEGYDYRSEARVGAMLQSKRLARMLTEKGCVVREDAIITVGEDFNADRIGKGVVFSGRVDIRGDVTIGDGSSISNSFIIAMPPRVVRIGENARIVDSVIVDSTVGEKAVLEKCDVFQAEVEAFKPMRNMVFYLEDGKACARIRGTPELDHSGLEALEGFSLEALEKVFGITVDLGARIYVEPRVKRFLQTMMMVAEKEGGLKKFDKKFTRQLRSLAFTEIPGLEEYGDVHFYVGVNSFLSGEIVFRGEVHVKPWCVLHNSMIEESRIERGAIVWNSILKKCSVKSSLAKRTIIDRENLNGMVVDEGWRSPGSAWKSLIIFKHGE